MLLRKIFVRGLDNIQRLNIWPHQWRRVMLRWMGIPLARDTIVSPACHFGSGNVHFGKRVFLNIGCHVDTNATVTFGDDVACAPGVMFVTSNHEMDDPLNRAGSDIHLPITIGRGCWLGTRCMILPGVTIAPGCVIAAGAVLTKDTTPNGIYAGAPARRIRDMAPDLRAISPSAGAACGMLPQIQAGAA